MGKLYDFIVVGAGLSGAVAAYELSRMGYSVLVIEKNPSVGGLCRCQNVTPDVPIHVFGPHIFHTNDKRLWDYVSNRCEMIPYEHIVKAVPSKELGDISLPININTVEQIYDVKIKNASEISEIIKNDIIKCDNPITVEDFALSTVGAKIYKALIEGYTEKQWGKPCSALPSEIVKRLQIRTERNESYFSDKYVGIPKNGWNELFKKLLKNCDVLIKTDYLSAKELYNKACYNVIYTGKIDEYFNYAFGRLEYIDHIFNFPKKNNVKWKHDSAVVNYTGDDNSCPLRAANYALMYGKKFDKYHRTDIIEEYAVKREDAFMYPVPSLGKNIPLNLYRNLAESEENVLFVGRNAEYKYYDMDDCIARSIAVTSNFK